MFGKTTAELKEAFVANVSVPSKQAQILAGAALIIALVALIIVVTKDHK